MSSEITCPSCRRLNSADSSFCIGCGGRLTDSVAPASDTPASAPGDEAGQDFREELASARSELREAGLLLDQLQDRISRLELGQVAPAPAGSPAPVVQQPTPAALSAVEPEAPPPDPPLTEDSPPLTPPPGPARSPDLHDGGRDAGDNQGFPGISVDWEQVLGRNWFAIIGAVALVLGIGFFLKLAFDNNWIGDTGRIALGIGLGIVLLGVGEYAQRRVPMWAQPVTAGGAAILYLSMYAAFGLYQILRPDVAFLFMALVVALAGLLALRYQSIVIAILGIIGAFVAPVLLGQDLPDVRLLLAYILVVDLGILGVSTFRNWRWFTLLGWAGSYGLFTYWLDAFPGYEPVLVQIALTGVFLVFAGATTLFHLLWRRVPNPFDMTLVGINAMSFFGLTVAIMWPDYELWFGLIALALSLFYGLIAFAVIRRTGAPPEIALISLVAALVFLTIAVPLQLSGVWVPVAWAAQGTALVWAGLMLRRWPMRAFGLGALALSVVHLAWFDVGVNLADFTPVLNERFPVFLALIAAFYASGFLYWRNRAVQVRWEEYTAAALVGIANLLTLTLFSLEIINYFDSRQRAMPGADSQQWVGPDAAKYLSLTILLTAYAFILSAVGLARRLPLVRWAGVGLMGVAVFKLLVWDALLVQLDPLTFTTFLNARFLTFFIVLAALAGAAYWFRRESPRLTETEAYIWQILVVAANLVGVWALSQEIIYYFGSLEARLGGRYSSATHLSLTVFWAVYAIGVIGAGIGLRSARVRQAGIGLLALPVAKLFVYDIFLLERGYRVAAFVTLGVLLLGMGLVYQRYSRAVRGFLFGRQA